MTTAKTPAPKPASEHVEQRNFVEWIRLRAAGTVRIFAIPNGGKRGRVEAGRLKVEGVSAGVPDLYIPAWRMWVEMKATDGRVTKEQADWHEYLRGLGDVVIVAYGFDDARRQVEWFLKDQGEE